MSPGTLDVMNIHDVYARICMPVPPSYRVLYALQCDTYCLFATQYTWYLVNTGRTLKEGCLITDFRTAGRGKSKFGLRVDDTGFSTVHGEWDRNIDFRRLWDPFASFCDIFPKTLLSLMRGFWRRRRHFSTEQGPSVRLKATFAVSSHSATWRRQTGISLPFAFWASPAWNSIWSGIVYARIDNKQNVSHWSGP
jgi:hypothetical protein